MVIQTSKDYKEINNKMKGCVLGLIITACENKKKRDKIETFLTKDSQIISQVIFDKLFEHTEITKPEDYNSFFADIKKRVIINSFNMEELSFKAEELFKFAKKNISCSKKVLRKLCNLEY